MLGQRCNGDCSDCGSIVDWVADRPHLAAVLMDPLTWLGGPADPFLILLLALAIDAAVGDPDWLYRALPHPVALVGKTIEVGERWLNAPRASDAPRFLAGLLLTLFVIALAAAVGWLIGLLLGHVFGGWLIEAVLASILLAGRGLYDHVQAVARGLSQGLGAGRAAVARIVGRDPESLDAAGVRRAAVDSLAENFSDGLVAPAFWYALFGLTGYGLAGLCAYKAINTLDSMIGHRDERYRAFGKAAARLDDAANWLPARLAGSLVVVGAALLPGASAGRAWTAMLHDAPKHRSPNAGWQEAAFAGALDLALAGPRRYGEILVEDAWMGDGRHELTEDDLIAALRLYLAAWGTLSLLAAAIWALPLG